MVVKADGKKLLEKAIAPDNTTNGWAEISVDLTPLAGKSVLVELVNQPSEWRFEAAYWAKIGVESR